MEFDFRKYTDAMEQFLLKMEEAAEADCPDMGEGLHDICQVLRIARVEAEFWEASCDDSQQKAQDVVLYGEGSYDGQRACRLLERNANGRSIWYVFYQVPGEPDWDETEIRKIHSLEKMIYSFSKRLSMVKQVQKMKFRDAQFPIYNLSYMMHVIQEKITRGELEQYAACHFDMKRFSFVNQQIGREAGTKVLWLFTAHIQTMLDEDECICHVGGDRFAALFRKGKLDQIVDAIQETEIVYDEKEKKKIIVGAYAGYYVIPDNHAVQDPTDVMDRINMALHTAKNVTKCSVIFWDETSMKKQDEAKRIESEFREALEKNEFVVYYQPKVNLKDYRLAGAEALCRWIHNGKSLQPDHFIPVLEQTDAICKLDFYVLEQVCKDIRRWLDEGKEVVCISVNLSRRHMEDMGLLEHILSIIDRYEVPHSYIEIELTETTTDVEFKDLRRIVTGLQNNGIHASVDDFGIGYSSLNLIRELAWNVLKIDKSFLPKDIKEDSRELRMFKYIVALAQNMGMECIVEGVETVQQVCILKENNCYMAQGFYFDKPLPVDVFESRMMTNREYEVSGL